MLNSVVICNAFNFISLVVIKDNETTTWTNKDLEKGTYYKYYVKAYKLVNGKKVFLAKSKTIRVTTMGGTYGNPKAVKVNENAITLATKEESKMNLPPFSHFSFSMAKAQL